MKQELIMEQKIEQARGLLRKLECGKVCQFEQAKRFFLIQEALDDLKTSKKKFLSHKNPQIFDV